MELIHSFGVLGISKFGGFSRNYPTNSATQTTFKSSIGLNTPRHHHVAGSKLERAIYCLPSEPTAITAKPKRGRPRKKKAEPEEKTSLKTNEGNLGDDVKNQSSAEKRGRKKKRTASVEAFIDTSLRNLTSETEARDSTLNQVRQTKNGSIPENAEPVGAESNTSIVDGIEDEEPQLAVVEEEDAEWVDDEDVEDRWKVRASDFFKEPLITNGVGEDGTLINWEGEADNGIIQEICSMEWEDMAFHPTPLVVLVFERYTRICDNWKALKELEKAFKVYWKSHNKLPPRTVKIDAKIERDLASALRVKGTPEILFIRGGKPLYRETEVRTADELVQMIAHFYYNAKRPTWLRDVTHT